MADPLSEASRVVEQTNAIRNVCRTEPSRREDWQVQKVLDFCKDVKFFQRLTEEQQWDLAKSMRLETYEAKDVVFNLGDYGDKFYIVLDGGVHVQIQRTLRGTKPSAEDAEQPGTARNSTTVMETINFLLRGIGFGDLALQSDQPRSATVIASERTDLLYTTRADYDAFAGKVHRAFMQKRVDFLASVPSIGQGLIDGLIEMNDLITMADFLQEHEFSGGQVAFEQGKPVDSLVLLRSGQLALIRRVDMDKIKREDSRTAATTPDSPNKQGSGRSLSPVEKVSTVGFAKKLISQIHHLDTASDEEVASPQPPQPDRQSSIRGGVDRRTSAPQSPAQEPKSGDDMWRKLRGAMNVNIAEKALEKALETKGKKVTYDSDESRMKAELGFLHDVRVAKDVLGRKSLANHAVEWRQKAKKTPLRDPTINNHMGHVKARNRRKSQLGANSEEDAEPGRKVHGRRTRLMKAEGANRFGAMMTDARKAADERDKRRAAQKVQHAMNRRLFRCGVLVGSQTFGEAEVLANGVFPCSLVAEPVACVYTITKNDLMRRISKKVYQAIFGKVLNLVPPDEVLVDMSRQTDRWGKFKTSLHGEAMERANRKSNHVDVMANLELLGHTNPHEAMRRLRHPPLGMPGVMLTRADEERFSQCSTQFIRRFDELKRDEGLRQNLERQGLLRGLLLDCMTDEKAGDDAMDFHVEQYWAALRQDPIGQDLDEAVAAVTVSGPFSQLDGSNNAESKAAPAAAAANAAATAASSSLPRGSAVAAVRRGTQVNARASNAGKGSSKMSLSARATKGSAVSTSDDDGSQPSTRCPTSEGRSSAMSSRPGWARQAGLTPGEFS
eukprot:TRINITY_DN4071_c0_g1_i2.p1 TRINITY_DN4071_c0_g1~~TRINITY_DN4071_c0_g1_i2.p1  ORF type:complete len:839 (+),score=168.84 TRINITY_DN4071_c0_g1_i2:240-2756(+)